MPRSIPTLLVTAVAVVLLVSFRAAPKRVSPKPTPSATAGTPPPTRSARPSPTRTSTPTRRLTGAAVQDPYGTVQVVVTIRGSRITDVQPAAIPLDSGRSRSINTVAAPLLRQEVLRAQSARIDVVSGATYTSEAYAQSLQAALDRAGA